MLDKQQSALHNLFDGDAVVRYNTDASSSSYINANSHRIVNVDLCVSDMDAANKSYVDAIVGTGAGVRIADSASTILSGTVVFSNSNNLSFGLSGSTMTGSVAPGVQSLNSSTGAIVFAAGNNITLSQNLSTITISAFNQSVQPAVRSLNSSSGDIVFVGGSSISLSQSQSTITINYNGAIAPSSFVKEINGSSGSLSIVAGSNITLSQSLSVITINGASGATGDYAGTNGAITGGSITVNTSGVSVNLPAYLTTFNQSAFVLSDSNGVGWGTNGSTVTASYSQSTHSHGFAGTNGAITGGSITVNTSGVSVDLPAYITAQTAFVLSASNGLGWGTNGSTITGSYSQSTHAHPYIGSANVSMTGGSITASSDGLSIALPAYLTTFNQSAFVLSNSNSFTFGTNGSTVTASFSQSTHAHDFAGTNGAITGGSMTVNTSGISIDLPDYMLTGERANYFYTSANTFANLTHVHGSGTDVAGTNITITSASNGISLSVGNYLTGQSAFVLSNSNNFTFGTNGSTVTASFSQSTHGHDFAGTNGAITGGSITVNTSGVSVNLPAYLTTFNQSAFVLSASNGLGWGTNGSTVTGSYSQSTHAHPFAGTNGAITGGSITVNTSGVSVDLPAYISSQSNQALSASNGSFTFQTANFADSNGVSFSTGTQGIYASILEYMRTGERANYFYTSANTFAGVNGAITGGSITVNTSGVSVDLPAYLTTFNQSAFVLSNSNGVGFGTNGSTVTASYTVPTLTNPAISGSNTSLQASTYTFGNSNGLLFYITNNSIVGSYTVPAVPAQTAFVLSASNGLGWGTNGSTVTGSYSQSTHDHLFVQSLNGSSGQISISGAGNISISNNASTVIVSGGQTISRYYNFNFGKLIDEDIGTEHDWLMGSTHQSWGILPLCAHNAGGFPGYITISSAYLNFSCDLTNKVANTNAFTYSAWLALYSAVNTTSLKMMYWVSTTFGSNADNNNMRSVFGGIRYLPFVSSQFSNSASQATTPSLSQGAEYYIGYAMASSGEAKGISFIGMQYAASNQRSGTIGVAAVTDASLGWSPFLGRYTAVSAEPPVNIGQSDLSTPHVLGQFVPLIHFENLRASI